MAHGACVGVAGVDGLLVGGPGALEVALLMEQEPRG